MKAGSTLVLKTTLVVLALGAVAVCVFGLPAVLRDNNLEYYRPIIIGLYLPVIPFLLALHQAWKLLVNIDTNNAFSVSSVEALKKIKYCAMAISGLFVAGLPYFFYAFDKDDAPGGIVIVLVIISASVVVATFAALLQKLIKSGLDLKSENELTV